MEDAELVILTKEVTTTGPLVNGDKVGRVMSFPSLWIKHHFDPKKIVLVLGDIIVVGREGDEERVIDAAKCLIENKLMTALSKEKGLMRKVEGGKNQMEVVEVL